MHSARLGLLYLPLTVAIHSQEVLRSYFDLWSAPFIAGPLDSLEDFDGDGFRDMVLGDPHLLPSGEVHLLSGATGSLLRVLSLGDSSMGARVVGLADVSGDGVTDFLDSGRFVGTGHLWSGADLELLWSGDGFGSAASIGDIDGDGVDDFLLSGYGFVGSPGWALVYYGARYTLAYPLPAPAGAVHFGHAVAAMGDVDGDGFGDFAIGAPAGISDTICLPGEVYVFSGKNGQLVYRLHGKGVDSMFGANVTSPGDMNGDGIGDLAVAGPRCCTEECGDYKQGEIGFFDGATGQELSVFSPDGSEERGFGGSSFIAIGDLDGNGFGDVLTSGGGRYDRFHYTARLIALDGGTRKVIYRLRNPYGLDYGSFGIQLAPAGDVDGDDFPDYFASAGGGAIGMPDDRIDLISGAPRGVRSIGIPCGAAPGQSPRIGATGVPEVGRKYPIHLSGVAPGTEARLLLGDLRSVELFSAGRASCPPLVRPADVRLAVAEEVRPGVGVATTLVSIPNDPRVIGMKFHAQWLIAGRPWSTSRVLEIEIQPNDPLRVF